MSGSTRPLEPSNRCELERQPPCYGRFLELLSPPFTCSNGYSDADAQKPNDHMGLNLIEDDTS